MCVCVSINIILFYLNFSTFFSLYILFYMHVLGRLSLVNKGILLTYLLTLQCFVLAVINMQIIFYSCVIIMHSVINNEMLVAQRRNTIVHSFVHIHGEAEKTSPLNYLS